MSLSLIINRISFLMIIGFIFTIVLPVMAETQFSNNIGTISIENTTYEIEPGKLTIVKISGLIEEPVTSALITIVITSPNGSTEGTQILPTIDGYFISETEFDETSELGQYSVLVTYQGQIIGTVSFSLEEKKYSQDDILEARGISTTKQELSITVEESQDTLYDPEPIFIEKSTQEKIDELNKSDYEKEKQDREVKLAYEAELWANVNEASQQRQLERELRLSQQEQRLTEKQFEEEIQGTVIPIVIVAAIIIVIIVIMVVKIMNRSKTFVIKPNETHVDNTLKENDNDDWRGI